MRERPFCCAFGVWSHCGRGLLVLVLWWWRIRGGWGCFDSGELIVASRDVVVGWSRGDSSGWGLGFWAVCGQGVVDGGDGLAGGLGGEVAVGVGGRRQGGV